MPKKEIKDIQSLKKEDFSLLLEIFKTAQNIAEKFDLKSYRILTNYGEDAGQSVFHLHFHLIGKKKLGGIG